MVIWLIGMSGAGKTFIGRPLADRLRGRGRPVVFLDGDVLREVFGNDLGHTIEDRRKNAGRVSRLCRMIASQGIDVVCAILSIFPESQRWNREHIPGYFEVFVDVPVDELRARDAKGLYAAAARGEARDVVGVDIPFPRPAQPDLTLYNGEPVRPVDELVDDIVARLPDAHAV